MVCLGFKPGAAGWKAQTNPLNYGGTPLFTNCKSSLILLLLLIECRESRKNGAKVFINHCEWCFLNRDVRYSVIDNFYIDMVNRNSRSPKVYGIFNSNALWTKLTYYIIVQTHLGCYCWAVVGTQLTLWLATIPQDLCSYPVIGNFYATNIYYCQLCVKRLK